MDNREYASELYHYGIIGQKWGIRRYQNPDGSLTEEGKKRYGHLGSQEEIDAAIKKDKIFFKQQKDIAKSYEKEDEVVEKEERRRGENPKYLENLPDYYEYMTFYNMKDSLDAEIQYAFDRLENQTVDEIKSERKTNTGRRILRRLLLPLDPPGTYGTGGFNKDVVRSEKLMKDAGKSTDEEIKDELKKRRGLWEDIGGMDRYGEKLSWERASDKKTRVQKEHVSLKDKSDKAYKDYMEYVSNPNNNPEVARRKRNKYVDSFNKLRDFENKYGYRESYRTAPIMDFSYTKN